MLLPIGQSESRFQRWWRPGLSAVLGGALLIFILRPEPPPPPYIPAARDHSFLADFDSTKLESCLAEGSQVDDWRFAFSGFGCNAVSNFDDRRWLHIQPKASTRAGESHSALAVGPLHGSSLTLTGDVLTMRQLRSGSTPQPWETGWVLWGFRDLNHFYYLAIKTNGWEIGKIDSDHKGRQRYLASGSEVKAEMLKPNQFRIVQEGPTMSVEVDGKSLAKITDSERPYTQGRVAVYCQDADALFGAIRAGRFSGK